MLALPAVLMDKGWYVYCVVVFELLVGRAMSGYYFTNTTHSCCGTILLTKLDIYNLNTWILSHCSAVFFSHNDLNTIEDAYDQ